MPKSLPISTGWNEVFMVGIDTATSVYGNGCQEPFPVAGKREKLTVWPGPEQFSSVDRQKITRAFRDK